MQNASEIIFKFSKNYMRNPHLSKKFYEERFSEKGVTSDNPEMTWLVDNIEHELNIKENDRVLDVGCGDGYVVEKTYDDIHVKGYGIDCSAEAIRTARHFSRNYGRDLDFVIGDARYLPFIDDFFDKIVCSEIIEHVSNDSKCLVELRRVLHSRGLIYVTFPNENVFLLFRACCNVIDKVEGHLRRYDFMNTKTLLNELGFRTLNARFTGHFFTWIIRQFVTYNLPIKKILKTHFKQQENYGRPNYLYGFLSTFYSFILVFDLKINRKDCMGFYVIMQKP